MDLDSRLRGGRIHALGAPISPLALLPFCRALPAITFLLNLRRGFHLIVTTVPERIAARRGWVVPQSGDWGSQGDAS